MGTVAEQLEVATQLEVAQAARDRAQAEVDRLFNRRAELTAMLEAIGDEVHQGKSERVSEVAGVAAERSEIEKALHVAEEEFEHATQQFNRAAAAERTTRFDEVIRECRDRRARFAQLFREACLELGYIINLRGEALELFNGLTACAGPAVSPIYYQDPNARNALTEINEALVSIPDLCAGLDGLEADTHLGWKTAVSIVPLHFKKGRKTL